MPQPRAFGAELNSGKTACRRGRKIGIDKEERMHYDKERTSVRERKSGMEREEKLKALQAEIERLRETMAKAPEMDQTENICIVSDAEIPSNLVFFDVFRADDDDNFSLIAELFQKSEFTVGSKTRQHAGGVIIVKKFSSEFKVKFVVEFADSVTNVFRLHFQILFVVKTDFHIFPFQILLCIYIGWR